MRLAWATDLHLEFVEADRRAEFVESLRATNADAVLLTGDIALHTELAAHLEQIANTVDRPVYFVLGNHDYYGSSIETVREATRHHCRASSRLHWMNDLDFVSLSPDTALVGHDGWADGRLGDYENSDVELNDYYVIDDFKGLDRSDRLRLLNRLGDEAAEHFRRVLPEALAEHRKVIALTHAPPFQEACLHRGQPSTDGGLPHFSNRAAGEAMIGIMREQPDRELLVLCGHTHSFAEAEILPNLRVIAGGARYTEPRVQRVLEWD